MIRGGFIPTNFFYDLLTEFDKSAKGTPIKITVDFNHGSNMVSFKFNGLDTFMFYSDKSTFDSDNSTLRLTYVTKRSEISTRVFIEKMIKIFNQRRDFDKFTLGDTSELKIQDVTISLYKMKILENAYTWYESMGFINGSLAEKREEVVKFIDQKLVDVVTNKTVLEKYQEQIDLKTILIREFMLFIKDKLINPSAKDEIEDIRNIIDTLFSKLEETIGVVEIDHYMEKPK